MRRCHPKTGVGTIRSTEQGSSLCNSLTSLKGKFLPRKTWRLGLGRSTDGMIIALFNKNMTQVWETFTL